MILVGFDKKIEVSLFSCDTSQYEIYVSYAYAGDYLQISKKY